MREGEAASVLCRRESRSDGESKGNGMEKGKHATQGKTLLLLLLQSRDPLVWRRMHSYE